MANYHMLGGDGKEYGPVTADQLRQWLGEGRANAQTQVRSTDGGTWTPLGSVPELHPTVTEPRSPRAPSPQSLYHQAMGAETSPTKDSHAVEQLVLLLNSGNSWVKFIAIVQYVSAGLLAITIVGLIIAWMPFLLGKALMDALEKCKQAGATRSEADLNQALDKFRYYFKLRGVFGVIAIGLVVLGGIVAVLLIPLASKMQAAGGGNPFQ